MTGTIAAEYPKFTAPMLLVHGLWSTAAVWGPFAGYFAHLGWTCHTLSLRGHGVGDDAAATRRLTFADLLEDVRGAIEACEAPPVLLGHDLGGLLALHCAARARAVVALAPLVPRPLAAGRALVLSNLHVWSGMWRSRPLPPPGGRTHSAYFGHGVPGGTTVESRRLVRQLARNDLRFTVACNVPQLLIAGEADVVSWPQEVKRLATYAGAAFRQVDRGGHALPWEPGWQSRVTEIHRWLVQELGDSLLVVPEEE